MLCWQGVIIVVENFRRHQTDTKKANTISVQENVISNG